MAPQYAGGRKLDKPGAAPASREGTLTAIAGYRIANIKPDIASDAAARVWARDSSFWGPGDDDPADRLGWLESPDEMSDAAPDLVRFAESAAGTDFSAVALLGMGGSALASEVFARTVPGRGTQFVLCDSTHPSEVQRAAAALDLDHTLFVVSSKSGTTVETISLYRYFRALTDDGSKFVAITDPGTPLEDLARRDRFLATFTNRPDIGGRFSALSYFGLVPAALVGVDIAALIAGARTMAERCSASTPAAENPGVVLGSALGLLANGGRDKLTLVTPPRLRALGGWIEQLVAESTGKRGTGIVPVVDEPPAEPKDYGNDRAFVHIRLEGDDSHDHVDQLIGAGHPVIGIDVDDVHDLGAEMFRWEFAVVVASAILGINAFDQPDVEAAKSSARTALQSVDPIDWPDEDPGGLFEDIAPPELAALLLFTPASEAATSVLDAARRKLLSGGRGVATSAGFGPRYLHSTGQLHKGGPKGVRALVVLDPPTDDVAVPGTDYGFARLVTAQALGDARALESAGRRAACTSFESFRRWAGS